MNKLAYVRGTRKDCSVSAMCGERGCDCRYRMRYTRGYERRFGDWEPLEALFVDKVAIRKHILEEQLGEGNLPEKEKNWTLIELRMINKRWGSEGCRRVDKETRPLWTSQEWVTIQSENQIGRTE